MEELRILNNGVFKCTRFEGFAGFIPDNLNELWVEQDLAEEPEAGFWSIGIQTFCLAGVFAAAGFWRLTRNIGSA